MCHPRGALEIFSQNNVELTAGEWYDYRHVSNIGMIWLPYRKGLYVLWEKSLYAFGKVYGRRIQDTIN